MGGWIFFIVIFNSNVKIYNKKKNVKYKYYTKIHTIPNQPLNNDTNILMPRVISSHIFSVSVITHTHICMYICRVNNYYYYYLYFCVTNNAIHFIYICQMCRCYLYFYCLAGGCWVFIIYIHKKSVVLCTRSILFCVYSWKSVLYIVLYRNENANKRKRKYIEIKNEILFIFSF